MEGLNEFLNKTYFGNTILQYLIFFGANRIEEAMKIIEETIKSVDGTQHDNIMIRFINFGPYSLDLETVYWITDMSAWRMIIHRVNMGIKRNLDDAGNDMAFPTETHYVIKEIS